jgi:hypothetical protein
MVEFSNFPNPPKGAGKELCFWGYYLYQGKGKKPLIINFGFLFSGFGP